MNLSMKCFLFEIYRLFSFFSMSWSNIQSFYIWVVKMGIHIRDTKNVNIYFCIPVFTVIVFVSIIGVRLLLYVWFIDILFI